MPVHERPLLLIIKARRGQPEEHSASGALGKNKKTERSPLGRLAVDVVGHVIDVIRAQLLAEGRHGVLAVRNLRDDGRDAVAAREVLLQGFLLEFFLRHDGVVAASMARCAVAVEDALAILQVSGQGRLAARHRDEQTQRSTNGQRAPGGGLGLCLGKGTLLLQLRRRHAASLRRTARCHRSHEAARTIQAEGHGNRQARSARHGEHSARQIV
mmetsp:Transcript_9795/g.26031  ORF Transcript_9795/g.26031 Transcript_9795/m.26031 type:complete len:213 (+) Transcript_9795:203-841(+)